MSARGPHILVVNAWHDDNKGDAAITAGILTVLGRAVPTARFTVVGATGTDRPTGNAARHTRAAHPAVSWVTNPLPTERPVGRCSHPLVTVAVWLVRLLPSWTAFVCDRPVPRWRALVADADVVVGVGGANLYSDPAVRAGVSLARLFTMAAPFHAAHRLGRPVLLLGHTLGPFPADRPRTLRVARRMLAGVRVTVLRDAASRVPARRLGLPLVEVAPDLAYMTVPSPTSRVVTIARRCGIPLGRKVIVATRTHPSLGPCDDERTRVEIADAVVRLARAGAVDGAVVVAHTVGPTAVEDDRPAARALAAHLARRCPTLPVTLVDEDLSPAELAWLYGHGAAMIAVRLHAAILATISGTPVFAISYFAHKTHGVLAAHGRHPRVGDFASVTGEEIASSLSRQLADPHARPEERASARIARRTLELRGRVWLALGTSTEDDR